MEKVDGPTRKGSVAQKMRGLHRRQWLRETARVILGASAARVIAGGGAALPLLGGDALAEPLRHPSALVQPLLATPATSVVWPEHDVALLLQDRRRTTDNSFAYAPSPMDLMSGYLGNTVLVNGTPDAELSVAATRHRFRLLNGRGPSECSRRARRTRGLGNRQPINRAPPVSRARHAVPGREPVEWRALAS